MRLSVEVYVLSEFAVTAGLLALTARLTGALRTTRVLLAALLSTVASAVIRATGRGAVFSWIVLPASVILTLGWVGRFSWLRGTGLCLLLSAAFAGSVTLLQEWLPTRGMARAPLLMAPFYLAIRRLRSMSYASEATVRLRVKTEKGTAEFTALIDTGNQLREPFSGQPVLIVSANRLRGVIEAKLIPEREDAALPPGFRIVCYRTLEGGGRLRCFRPESVKCLWDSRWVEAPPMWIGVYRGRLPGGVSALAPACCGAEAANSGMGGEAG